MRTRNGVLVAGLAAITVGLTGCPSDSCGPQTPQVSNVPGACTVNAGQQVTYEVRLCPSCNETGGSCTADTSQAAATGYIYLDISTQACSGGDSCPAPTCNTNATTCTFMAPPSSPNPYHVVIPNGQADPYTRDLQVVSAGTPTSCTLAAVPPSTF